MVAFAIARYWLPVDLYVGGGEHATLHLLYARFWHKALYDLGIVTTKEPFRKLVRTPLVLVGLSSRQTLQLVLLEQSLPMDWVVDCEQVCQGMILGPTEYTAFQRADTGDWVSAQDVSALSKEERTSVRRIKVGEADVVKASGSGGSCGASVKTGVLSSQDK